jgi:ABC-type transport system involved in multi-copper enzyme maturation permease subunit
MTAAVLELEQVRGRAGLAGAVASEWTKLWTVRSTWLNLASSVVLTALLGAQFGFSGVYENTHLGPGQVAEQMPVGEVAINVTTIVQVVVAALAMLTITSEYSTGSIRSTLQWTPVRRNVLLAKAIVLTPMLFLSGLLFGAIAAGSGRLALGEWAEVNAGALTGDLLSVAGYLTLAGLFTLGIGVLIRSAAGTLTAAFLLLVVAPMMLAQSGFRILIWIAALLPGGAGQNFLTGTTDPIPPALSLAVLVAWAASALYLGTKLLQRRDA